jgi:hypothetical protein
MSRIAIIGAGITGVTTAYALAKRGFDVTVLERHRYAAMETSFANGGQLSASNAEVWNSRATLLKGLKWMFTQNAPLLMNPSPSWHKYSWIGSFLREIPRYRQNTIETVRLAIAAREHLFDIAQREGIEFNHERRGILHVYATCKEFDAASNRHSTARSTVVSLLNRIRPAIFIVSQRAWHTLAKSSAFRFATTRPSIRSGLQMMGRMRSRPRAMASMRRRHSIQWSSAPASAVVPSPRCSGTTSTCIR